MGIFSKRKVMEFCAGLTILLAMIGLVTQPMVTVNSAKEGLELCFNVIVPTLFPFFVLSSMLIELGIVRYLGKFFEKVMRPLFNLNGACAAAFALGFVGGYPTGARTAISIYEKGMCSKTEAERMLGFCNNSGPAFILGVVGAGIFSSGSAGVMLYLTHMLASATVGIIFRFYKRRDRSTGKKSLIAFESVSFTEAFTTSVKSGLTATLNICAFVVFFTVSIKMLAIFGIIPLLAKCIAVLLMPLGITADAAERIITGFIEVSSGVWSLRDAAGGMRQQLAMAAFMLGWAGISVHCQVLSFIGESGISTRTYIIGKFMHGIISAIYAYIFSGMLGITAPVSSLLVEQLQGITSLGFTDSLAISVTVSAVISAATAVFLAYQKRKRVSG